MKTQPVIEDWLRLSAAVTFLWAESVTVVWLRTAMLFTGGKGAQDEAVRMIAEKFRGSADLAIKFAADAPRSPAEVARRSIKHYGGLVSANRTRLTDRSAAQRPSGR